MLIHVLLIISGSIIFLSYFIFRKLRYICNDITIWGITALEKLLDGEYTHKYSDYKYQGIQFEQPKIRQFHQVIDATNETDEEPDEEDSEDDEDEEPQPDWSLERIKSYIQQNPENVRIKAK